MNYATTRRALIMKMAGGAAVCSLPFLGACGGDSTDESTTTSDNSAEVNSSIPVSVDVEKALASQGPTVSSDSIYFAAHVEAEGHTFGILVQTVQDGPQDVRFFTATVTDETTGYTNSYQTLVDKDEYSWSTEKLDIKTPNMTWTGDAKNMAVQVSVPWGTLDLKFNVQGPAMYYAGTGEWEAFGKSQIEYAFPSMQTTGTLTVDGKTYTVSGESWLDRQWGGFPLDAGNRWTWMNLSLSNGDKIAVWDIVGTSTESAWATVLHPDGSYDLVGVEPLANGVSKTWTSTSSSAVYPTQWRVEIPSLNADLTVKITGTEAQEIGSGQLARYEGTAAVTGSYNGKSVTGHNYVEMVGDWSKK